MVCPPIFSVIFFNFIFRLDSVYSNNYFLKYFLFKNILKQYFLFFKNYF